MKLKTRPKKIPSLEYLHECFEISNDSPSGLVWKERPRNHFKTLRAFHVSNKKYAGKPAGTLWFNPEFPDNKHWAVQIATYKFYVSKVINSLSNNEELV